MTRASASDRAYFERVGAANRALDQESVPLSLEEMFERIDRIRAKLGMLSQPGLEGPSDGDLASHLAFLKRVRTSRTIGAKRSPRTG